MDECLMALGVGAVHCIVGYAGASDSMYSFSNVEDSVRELNGEEPVCGFWNRYVANSTIKGQYRDRSDVKYRVDQFFKKYSDEFSGWISFSVIAGFSTQIYLKDQMDEDLIPFCFGVIVTGICSFFPSALYSYFCRRSRIDLSATA